jgi:hypothetical protein
LCIRKRYQPQGRAQRDQGKKGQQGQAQQAPQQGQAKQGKQDQAQQPSKSQQRDQTTGQAPQRQQGQQGQQGQTTGQAPQRQQGQTQQAPQQGQTQQAPQQGQAQQAPQQGQQGQAGQQGQTSGQTGASVTGQAGSVNLTAQQRTRIQQTVLASSNVPRVNSVNFGLSVGTLVPTSVRVIDVAPALIEINPAWRGHQYFVVRDDIIIVDHSRKIAAVVPVGSGGARLGTGGSTALNLSSDQIREVQTVLKERGFDVVVDGRIGPRTIEAITIFQRQQGLEVSRSIDNQTISALGLSNVTGAQSGTTQGGAQQQQAPAQQNQGANQPATSGQGGAQQQQAPALQNQGANQPSTSGQGANQQQAPAQQNQGANQPSTSGQGANQQQAPAQQNQGGNQPATSGQGGAQQQQAPAQQNPPAGQGQQNSGSK